MNSKTNIKTLLSDNKIAVPSYQRAYSWTTKGQVDVFLSDLDNHIKSETDSNYYIGHFIFEKTEEQPIYYAIDGQQRLTTIVIFLSALKQELKKKNELSSEEENNINKMIKNHFSTVQYDNDFFKSYIIDRTNIQTTNLSTESKKCIKKAFDYFVDELKKRESDELKKLLIAISKATCTTHTIEEKSEAIQMFIFQNNRGKQPTNLEILKALFMHNVLLHGGEDAESINIEIEQRFQDIYKYSTVINSYIKEDEVLNYVLQVYRDDLQVWGIVEQVEKAIKKGDRIEFIQGFTKTLCESYENLKIFYDTDSKEHYDIHSIVSLNSYNNLVLPFIIKAYKFDYSKEDICKLCRMFESFIIHQLIIGHRANITKRFENVFNNFKETNKDITPIETFFTKLHNTDDSWLWYWTDKEFIKYIPKCNHRIMVFILWKYENYLIQTTSGDGYDFSFYKYKNINKKNLEHIAPQTPPQDPIAAGYCEYDDNFKDAYLNSIGNYLLLSQEHNIPLSNNPFPQKRETYSHLEQQKEVVDMTRDSEIWDKAKIQAREKKLMEFIKEIYCNE
ncbi:MAG: DUF262 domain-containing HNH endonuclease family protein [Paludibacteraceae bacterium]|nr:DUF262 domain-containing HNH endonuclease family protein [Paludibacteraceae bacterium]